MHLIPLDNSSTCQILSAGRQELPSPRRDIPAIPERGNGVKLAMDGYVPHMVGRVPDRVRGQRTTQGARERYPRGRSSNVGRA